MKSHVEFVMKHCVGELLLDEADHTCVKLEQLFRKRYCTYRQLYELLKRLREDIVRGVGQEFFFHYRPALARMFFEIKGEWKEAITGFPLLEREIQAGVDCYAMEDYPGCVFHTMRIAEAGLREIARDVGVKALSAKRGEKKPIEWGTWDEVFTAIDNKSAETRKKVQGPKRDRLFVYYDMALTELKWMRGLYRDPTMHYRETYRKGEAFDAIGRTKNLVTTIAKRRGETRRKRA
jgi:hypothetical protein